MARGVRKTELDKLKDALSGIDFSKIDSEDIQRQLKIITLQSQIKDMEAKITELYNQIDISKAELDKILSE